MDSCTCLPCKRGLPLPSVHAAPMHPHVIKSVMWQLLDGLSYMHQNWVIHRDLKVSH